MGSMARLAAANNAEWCDIVCRSHALQGSFQEDAWTSPARTPPLYPDAVTLVPDVSVPDLLARIDTSPGCSIKDSFASLDLTPFGFSVLFDAQWTVRRAAPGRPPPGGLRWEAVRYPETFADWERAWRGGDGPTNVLRDDLIALDAVTVLACRDSADVVAGAILNRSAQVVGVTNFFSANESAAAIWSSCLGHIGARRPGAVLVGYESPSILGAARHDDVETAGPIRVWLRDR